MKIELFPQILFLLLTLIHSIHIEEQSFIDNFLGSPLLILAAIIVIDTIAFIYHIIRK